MKTKDNHYGQSGSGADFTSAFVFILKLQY